MSRLFSNARLPRTRHAAPSCVLFYPFPTCHLPATTGRTSYAFHHRATTALLLPTPLAFWFGYICYITIPQRGHYPGAQPASRLFRRWVGAPPSPGGRNSFCLLYTMPPALTFQARLPGVVGRHYRPRNNVLLGVFTMPEPHTRLSRTLHTPVISFYLRLNALYRTLSSLRSILNR